MGHNVVGDGFCEQRGAMNDEMMQTNGLDEKKKANVIALVVSSAAALTAVSFIPGDARSPIANKPLDLSSNLLIILAAVYLEKYLLTTLGLLLFLWLVKFIWGIDIPAPRQPLPGSRSSHRENGH